MNAAEFAARLRGDPKPSGIKVRNFAGRASTGQLPTKPSEFRQVRRFLEGQDEELPGWVGKAKAANKKSAEDHLASGVKNACMAIINDDSLEPDAKVKKLKQYLMAHAKLTDDQADAVAEHCVRGGGRSLPRRRGRRPAWKTRKLTLSERKALVGDGLKDKGRGRSLMESVCQPGIELGGEPIIRNVRVLGGDSKNRRRYTDDAMRQAIGLYEGSKVNLNHPGKPTDPRHLEDRFGKLVNVRQDGDGLVADLAYNPKHPMAETVRWWAENQPDAVGLSHNAVGEGTTESDGTFVVHRIARLRSVDLVADPATTSGLC